MLIPFSFNFTSLLYLALHASNTCILIIFLSATFLAFPPLNIYIYIALHASNKCMLPIFISVPFLALLALVSLNFYAHLNLACMLLINAYCPSLFPSLFCPFSCVFSLLDFHIAYFNKCILATRLSVLFSAFPPSFPLNFFLRIHIYLLLINEFAYPTFRPFSHLLFRYWLFT
jgi:hypothetical protein